MVDGVLGVDINICVCGGMFVIQSNDFFYIVDGFQVDNINDIFFIDIVFIDVLKDVFIMVIYGVKGGNGVVVVIIKLVKVGKIQVSFNVYLFISYLFKKLDLMNLVEFVCY